MKTTISRQTIGNHFKVLYVGELEKKILRYVKFKTKRINIIEAVFISQKFFFVESLTGIYCISDYDKSHLHDKTSRLGGEELIVKNYILT